MAEKKKPEDFMQRSSVDAWAAKGIGSAQTAVEGFLEMFSALPYREGSEVPAPELARWLDAYYQLRVNAEKQAEIGKFCAEQGVTLEPIAPKVNISKPSPQKKENGGFGDSLLWPILLALIFSGPAPRRCLCGPEVKDKDEKQPSEADKDDGKDEFVKLSPMGKFMAAIIAEKFKSEAEQIQQHYRCKEGHVAGDFICPHESEK